MRNDLPETCLATLPGQGDLIILKRGETGYYRSEWETGDKTKNQEIADFHNRRSGITPAQVEAMRTGSMFGFHVPGANPQVYFDEARYLRSSTLGASAKIKDPVISCYTPIKGYLYQYQVAGKESLYLNAVSMPEELMGRGSRYTFLPDMVHGEPLIPVAAKQSEYGALTIELEDGCFRSGKEMNAGYEIIAKVSVGPVEYALGELGGKFPSFVTWERTPANDGDGPPNYYWGHYFEKRDEAVRDFCDRAGEKYQMLAQNRKPSIKAQLAAKSGPGDKPIAKSKDREVR